MTDAFKKTRATSAREREIELIQARLAVLSEFESALERDNATLRAQRAAILQLSFGGGSRQSKIGLDSCQPLAVPSAIKVVYPGLTKFPWGSLKDRRVRATEPIPRDHTAD
jgi:hypothetical protein